MSGLVAGRLERLSPLIRRIVAPNAGMMTGPGTNTYLIGSEEVAVIDPGPADPGHIDAIIEATEGRLRRVLATHTHRDHSPGATLLAQRTGAQLLGMPPPATPENDRAFAPDRPIVHGQRIGCEEYTLEVIHTPGHASNHACYLLLQEATVFTGDHIMNGSTVVIAPPDGNMADYLRSLALLKRYALERIAPGHGEMLESPAAVVDWIIEHRNEREAKVLERLERVGPCEMDILLAEVYDEVDPRLLPLAKYSLRAHLDKLLEEDRAILEDGHWRRKG
ncbi:MAG: MBL fold metallo-hydrolase [Gammaproteobacteria bacterium]|jgi:glyoxylase-like metal-dependent hydrolase (beta-lactamase superfamily II)